MDYRKILAATVAVIGTVAMAADGIVSSSVVGYQTKGVTAGEYQMLGMQFTDLADSEGKVAIDKLVGMPDIAAQNYGDSRCPRIMTLREDGFYDFFYYINDALDANDDEVEGNVWTDDGGYVLTEPVAGVGEAFWCYASQVGAISVAL